MSDAEIVKRISVQLGFAVSLAVAARFANVNKATHLRQQAAKLIQFSLRLIATHKAVCERWMTMRRDELNSHA